MRIAYIRCLCLALLLSVALLLLIFLCRENHKCNYRENNEYNLLVDELHSSKAFFHPEYRFRNADKPYPLLSITGNESIDKIFCLAERLTPRLEGLEFYRATIDRKIADHIFITNPRHLNFGTCQFETNVAGSIVQACTNLEKIIINNCEMKYDFWVTLPHKRLIAIWFVNMSISYQEMEFLSRSKSVEQIFLNFVKMDDDCLSELALIDTIQEINLCGTNITGHAISSFSRLPNLRILSLSECNLSNVDFSWLEQRRLPLTITVTDALLSKNQRQVLNSLARLKKVTLILSYSSNGYLLDENERQDSTLVREAEIGDSQVETDKKMLENFDEAPTPNKD